MELSTLCCLFAWLAERKIACYLHTSIPSWQKCLLQVYTLSLVICFSKFLSMCLVFVNSFNQSSCHFLYSAFLHTGSFQMATPFLRLDKLQLKSAQLSPGISWKILYLLRGITATWNFIIMNYILQRDSIPSWNWPPVQCHGHVTRKKWNNEPTHLKLAGFPNQSLLLTMVLLDALYCFLYTFCSSFCAVVALIALYCAYN